MQPPLPPIHSSTYSPSGRPMSGISAVAHEKAARIVARQVVMATRHVGFTIVEVLIVALIVVFGFVALFLPILAGFGSLGAFFMLLTSLLIPFTDNWLRMQNLRTWRIAVGVYTAILAVYTLFSIIYGVGFRGAPAWVDPTAGFFYLALVLALGAVVVVGVVVVFVLIPMLINASRNYKATSDAANRRVQQAEAFGVAASSRRAWGPRPALAQTTV